MPCEQKQTTKWGLGETDLVTWGPGNDSLTFDLIEGLQITAEYPATIVFLKRHSLNKYTPFVCK